MITEIILKNFKCFKEETSFPLSKINLLTGVNGRGKSTLLQSLLLMRQTIEHNPNSIQIIFNGSCVRLGSFDDVKNSENSRDESIKMSFKINTLRAENIRIQYLLKDLSNDRVAYIEALSMFGVPTISNGFTISLDENSITYYDELEKYYKTDDYLDGLKSLLPSMALLPTGTVINTKNFFDFLKIHYVAADRLGPKDYYPKNNLDEFINVGPQGENTAIVLARKQDDIVFDALYLGENAKTVLQQTEEWLNKIFDGAKIELTVERDTISLSYNTKLTDKRYKPSNVGFGYSYILPIIVSGLIAEKGEILIVENPEAHLHPKAQSQLTKFLAKVASCGVQIYIESHSEHILNALRVVSVTQETEIQNTDISILYFQNDDEKHFTTIPINPDGGIDVWPEGFFDQTDKDFKILFGF